MTILEQEYLETKFVGLWVEVSSGRYAPGLTDDTASRTKNIYIYPDMAVRLSRIPTSNDMFARARFMTAEEASTYKIISLQPAVRYLPSDDGKSMYPGFYFSYYRVFFRWRNEIRDPSKIWFLPNEQAVSPVLDKGRVGYIIDITPPEDASSREPTI